MVGLDPSLSLSLDLNQYCRLTKLKVKQHFNCILDPQLGDGALRRAEVDLPH
jgi:hypothetical protein